MIVLYRVASKVYSFAWLGFAAGKNYMVASMARAAVAAGADGLLIETHDQPERALCDSAQALSLKQYAQLVHDVEALHETLLRLSPMAVEA